MKFGFFFSKDHHFFHINIFCNLQVPVKACFYLGIAKLNIESNNSYFNLITYYGMTKMIDVECGRQFFYP